MPAIAPNILALDFDGVLCDGLIEYFQTAWRTYCQIWSPSSLTPPDDMAPIFYRLRPVIEVGWEMPVLIRALVLAIPEEKILHDWPSVAQQILLEGNLSAGDIGVKLDSLRDEWIETDLETWLGLHRFYPGVVEKMRSLLADSSVQPIIVTTKEGRFVRQLLQQQQIEMRDEWIIGKECKRPKHQILRELIEASNNYPVSLWFIEDRLKTLQSVQQQPDLNQVKLYLADWGYNTAIVRESVRTDERIKLLSLSQFAQDLDNWP
jgi:phosphoglycolate phosphatase-like HAD superfamily hydrolase